MGITIKCKKTGSGCDLGYSGFERFRGKVAYLLNEEFGKHYEKLASPEMMFSVGKENRKLVEDFNKETARLIKKHKLSKRVLGFLFKPNSEGRCSPTACKAIYEVIKDYDDNICYGYPGRPDCAKFDTLKALVRECAEMKSYLEWS